MSAEGRVEHQKQNHTAPAESFGFGFGVQFGALSSDGCPDHLVVLHMSLKVSNDAQTLSKLLQNNFEKFRKASFLTPKFVNIRILT